MIVETIMRLKPVAERTSVTVHFLELDQHLDFHVSELGVNDGMVDVLWVVDVEWFVEGD